MASGSGRSCLLGHCLCAPRLRRPVRARAEVAEPEPRFQATRFLEPPSREQLLEAGWRKLPGLFFFAFRRTARNEETHTAKTPMGRVLASKTRCCGFESLSPCMNSHQRRVKRRIAERRSKALAEMGRLGAEYIMERLKAPSVMRTLFPVRSAPVAQLVAAPVS